MVGSFSPAASEQRLLRWLPGPIRCEDGAVEATPIRRPYSTLHYGAARFAEPQAELRFEIDADGRPVSIERVLPVAMPVDLSAALASSRFPAGRARRGCTVAFAPTPTPLTDAPVADLISYTLAPQNGRLPRSGWDRIRAAGDCDGPPRPQPLVRVLPDFRRLAGTPGVPDWTMVDYDIDKAGRPIAVRASAGTGNRALDAAAIAAMRASRFSDGPRTGCRYPYRRAAEILPAPPIPSTFDAVRDAATCTGTRGWAKPPSLIFPEPYRRRGIEGWAIVRFDVAPWGEVGDISVVAAQPTADFGNQAIQVLRPARLAPSPQGRTGCIERVRFVMAPRDQPHADSDDVPPLY